MQRAVFKRTIILFTIFFYKSRFDLLASRYIDIRDKVLRRLNRGAHGGKGGTQTIGDQNLISPQNIKTKSEMQVMRINELTF